MRVVAVGQMLCRSSTRHARMVSGGSVGSRSCVKSECVRPWRAGALGSRALSAAPGGDVSAAGMATRYMSEMEMGIPPSRAAVVTHVPSAVASAEDIQPAIELLAAYRYRMERITNGAGDELVRACVRVGALDQGAEFIRRAHSYRTSVSSAAAHTLVAAAAEAGDGEVLGAVASAMAHAGVAPCRRTRGVLRAVARRGEGDELRVAAAAAATSLRIPNVVAAVAEPPAEEVDATEDGTPEASEEK